jgi:hypothetical protein
MPAVREPSPALTQGGLDAEPRKPEFFIVPAGAYKG